MLQDAGNITEDVLSRLLAQWGRGDADAGDRLTRIYAPPIYSYLLRLTGRRETAQDLMQETFLRVVRGIGRYRHTGKFKGWIYRIATNLARDHFRRRGHRPAILSIDAAIAGDMGEAALPADESARQPHEALLEKEENRRVAEAVARLPEAERETVLLKYFSGLTFREISDIMGCPLGTALSRMHRALRRLERLLEKRG